MPIDKRADIDWAQIPSKLHQGMSYAGIAALYGLGAAGIAGGSAYLYDNDLPSRFAKRRLAQMQKNLRQQKLKKDKHGFIDNSATLTISGPGVFTQAGKFPLGTAVHLTGAGLSLDFDKQQLMNFLKRIPAVSDKYVNSLSPYIPPRMFAGLEASFTGNPLAAGVIVDKHSIPGTLHALEQMQTALNKKGEDMNMLREVLLEKRAAMDKQAFVPLLAAIPLAFAALGAKGTYDSGKESYKAFKRGDKKEGWQQAGWTGFNLAGTAIGAGWATRSLGAAAKLARVAAQQRKAGNFVSSAQTARGAKQLVKGLRNTGSAQGQYQALLDQAAVAVKGSPERLQALNAAKALKAKSLTGTTGINYAHYSPRQAITHASKVGRTAMSQYQAQLQYAQSLTGPAKDQALGQAMQMFKALPDAEKAVAGAAHLGGIAGRRMVTKPFRALGQAVATRTPQAVKDFGAGAYNVGREINMAPTRAATAMAPETMSTIGRGAGKATFGRTAPVSGSRGVPLEKRLLGGVGGVNAPRVMKPYLWYENPWVFGPALGAELMIAPHVLGPSDRSSVQKNVGAGMAAQAAIENLSPEQISRLYQG